VVSTLSACTLLFGFNDKFLLGCDMLLLRVQPFVLVPTGRPAWCKPVAMTRQPGDCTVVSLCVFDIGDTFAYPALHPWHCV
jgi:hypothetical protein